MLMNSVKNGKFDSNNELEQHAYKIFPYNTTICSILFIQKCEFVLYICGQKGQHFYTTLLIVKVLEVFNFLWRVNQSGPLQEKHYTLGYTHN